MSIQLNRIRKTGETIDVVIAQLNDTARKLEIAMNKLISEGVSGSKVVDLALARANVERLMIESGFYEVTGSLLDSTYQGFINAAHEAYKKEFGESLQYSDVSLGRLDQIRQLDSNNFNTIADDNINQLQKVMVDYEFGAIDLTGASERLAKIMGPDFQKYSETAVRSTANAFNREASNLLAIDGGLDIFEYVGPDDKVTSEFCEEQLKKGPQPLSYWESLMNPGGYPVMTYGGHPNCRHGLVPVLSKNGNE